MSTELPRRLGLLDATAIVVGIVIGGGIFIVPNLVAQNLPSAAMIMGVWALAGLVSFFGALACAELGAAFPSTGGQYVYLREAYGPLAGFLCGWSMFTVSRSAQVAWMAVTFALYFSYLVPLSAVASKVLGLAVLALFTWINYRGVRFGAAVQNSFTAAKLVGSLIIIGSAFTAPRQLSPSAAAGTASFSFTSVGIALIACLLAYDGWAQVTYVAGEIRNPKRNVVLALAIGMSVVMAVCGGERGRTHPRSLGRDARLRHHSDIDPGHIEWLLPDHAAPLFRAGGGRIILPAIRGREPAFSNAGFCHSCADSKSQPAVSAD